MTTSEVLNLMSAAFATVLAVVALWLSMWFFKQTNEQARRSERATDEIRVISEGLSKTFDSFKAEVWSTFTTDLEHLRNAAFPTRTDSGVAPADFAEAMALQTKRIEQITDNLQKKMAETLMRMGVSYEQAIGMVGGLTPAVERALSESSAAGTELGAKKNAFLISILREVLVKAGGGGLPPSTIFASMAAFGFGRSDVEEAMERGKADGWLSWDGDAERPQDEVPIRLSASV